MVFPLPAYGKSVVPRNRFGKKLGGDVIDSTSRDDASANPPGAVVMMRMILFG
jgi:hypothetical protein